MSFTRFQTRLPDVIKTDAVTVKRDVLLATHMPFQNLRVGERRTPDEKATSMDEEVFLDRFLYTQRDQHQFILVQGDNGSGKTHFIRWVKEKYQATEKEAIVFLSRAQSTLRGTIQQLIESDVFASEALKDNVKKLIAANEHLSDQSLQRIILHHFAIAVQEDEDSSEVTNREKKLLYAFLVDEVTQAFLQKENGPIDRMRKRLVMEVSDVRVDDVSPYFEPDDFVISFAELNEMQQQGDVAQNALRFATNIADTTDSHDLEKVVAFRTKIANYLNKFRQKVVEQCTQLRGSDLKRLFNDLRKELKRNGQTLTLFIEDITTFTGIDAALVDVLATDHEDPEHGEDSLCRLMSIVGTTNNYYNTSFPDNFKDRVTYRVFVDGAFLQEGSEQIVQMAARYLNTIYLDENELRNWVEEQEADPRQLPVADAFSEHGWATCEVQGKTLTIFPCNERMLHHLYQSLEQKTPRQFLLKVASWLKRYFASEQGEVFPPTIWEANTLMDVPRWNDSFSATTLARYHSEKERLETLFRLWGNRTIQANIVDGVKQVGGLTAEVFAAFQLPVIEGISVETKDKTHIKTTTLVQQERTDSTHENPIPATTPAPIVDPKRESFLTREKELEQWLIGSPLSTDLRDDLIGAIEDFIDWEAEGVPYILVNDNWHARRVKIEGQLKRTSGHVYFTIPRNNDTRDALRAISAWRILGGQSWEFAEASNYIWMLHNWLLSIKEQVINFVLSPGQESGDIAVSYKKWLVTAEVYLRMFAGELRGDETSIRSIYGKIVSPPTPFLEQTRSSSWSTVQQRFQRNQAKRAEHYTFFLRNFNLTQGGHWNTESYFFDAVELMQVIDECRKMDFRLDTLDLPETEGKQERSSLLSVYFLKQILHMEEILQEEKALLQERLNKIGTYLDVTDRKEQANTLFKEMKGFLTYLGEIRESYSSDDFAKLQGNGLTAQKLLNRIERLESILANQDYKEQLFVLSVNPFEEIDQYLGLFGKFDKLITDRRQKHEQRLANVQQLMADAQTDRILSETTDILQGLRLGLVQLQGEVKSC